ncbi:MAG: hypothetical protein AAB691_02940 [Patescibacteria group bacterium]
MNKTATWKKVLLVALIALLFLPQVSGIAVHAQSTVNYGAVYNPQSTTDGRCSANPATWLTCILIPFSWFTGLLVSLAAWTITFGLQINSNLAYSKMVEDGFVATLAIANLGFVFAIIVIAIATIIGYESYGMKKNLWKLVAAALLVNFSLVICSVIIGFFDQFAYYFARQMGTSSGTLGSTVTEFSGLADHLVDSFQLNKLTAWKGAVAILPTIIFIQTFLLIIAFTLFAVAFTLIIRYFYLLVLMILMPLAWLAWLIPGMEKHWHSWWQTFIKWTLSPTILIGFIYIAIVIATGSNDQFDDWISKTSTGAGAVVNQNAGNAGGPTLIDVAVKMLVSLALVWAAIIAANSLGAKGSTSLVNAGKSIGKGTKKWATLAGKNVATSPLRTRAGRSLTQGLQTLGTQTNNRLLRTIAAPVTVPLRYAGRGLSAVTKQGDAVLDETNKSYKDMALIEQARQYSTASAFTGGKFAILMNIQKAVKAAEDKKKNHTEGSKEWKEAEKAREEAVAALTLLPKDVVWDMNEHRHAANDKSRQATSYGKKFRLYGEHEKKHKDKFDEIKKLINEGDEHPTPPAGTTPRGSAPISAPPSGPAPSAPSPSGGGH